MQYRHPKTEEYAEITKLSNVAYRADWRDGKSDEDIIAEFLAEHPDDADETLSRHFMAFDDDGSVMAKVSNNSFEAYLHGKPVKLGGIGGVATYAEYRRDGHVRVLMNIVLEELYRQGYTLSYLYPFSHLFYRKFGYETHTTMVRYQLNLKTYQLKYQAPEGKWYMLRDKSDPVWSEVKSLYDKYASSLNLMIKREGYRWEIYQNADPYAGKQMTYLFRDANGVAEASFTFETPSDDTRKFNILDLSFRTTGGLMAVLEFCRRFSADYDRVSLPLPENYPLVNLVSEVPVRQSFEAMIRLIRVDKALSVLPNTLGPVAAKILVDVTDDQLTSNSGSYVLTYHGDLDNPLVERLTDRGNTRDYDAHLDVDVRELALLLSGSQSFAEMKCLPQIKFDGEERILEVIFPRYLNMQNDFY